MSVSRFIIYSKLIKCIINIAKIMTTSVATTASNVIYMNSNNFVLLMDFRENTHIHIWFLHQDKMTGNNFVNLKQQQSG